MEDEKRRELKSVKRDKVDDAPVSLTREDLEPPLAASPGLPRLRQRNDLVLASIQHLLSL